jgi:hypothetical protein
MKNMDKGLKVGADCLAENTPNVPGPKVLDFNEKKGFVGRP